MSARGDNRWNSFHAVIVHMTQMYVWPALTGQKKNPGRNCQEEETDRRREVKTPVHKGMSLIYSEKAKISRRKCVSV